jgi:DNA-binding response OmpR family regulator
LPWSLSLSNELVLLIEDNHEHATLIQALLDFRSLDSPVFVTASVKEACAYLEGEWPFDNRQRHPLPGLIVLDHWLLDGTGLEILEWLQDFKELASIPVVVFTACLEKNVEKRVRELGVRDYLVKPDGYEDLAVAIERILRPPPAEEAEDSKAG